MPTFRIRQGLRAGAEIDLQMSRIIIGRSRDSGVVLPDESVDLAHASLEERGNRWVLQDLGAPQGTRVNDDLVLKPRHLFDGDVIMVGKIRIEVQNVGDPPGEPPQVISITSLAEPAPAPQTAANKRLYLGVGLVGLVFVFAVFWLFARNSPLTSNTLPENVPPLLKVLLSEKELVVSPREKIVFISEVEDREDLARVEFWVNDVLDNVNHPIRESVVKMQTLHQWSTSQPGDYTLSIIAYDEAGQPSQMIRVQVVVQEP